MSRRQPVRSRSVPRSLRCGVLFAWLALAGGAACADPVRSEFYLDRYPDWRGQWNRVGSLNWPPEGYERHGPPPLTEEYQEVYAGFRRLQAEGIPAGDYLAQCLPHGMPRVMKMSYPMEIIVTPDVTYVYAESKMQIRRIFTDGRDWPRRIAPSYLGYSIGQWHDEDGDGIYDMLAVETRGMKGPRSFDALGVPLHENNRTVVLEEFRQIDEETLENRITTIDDALKEPWTIHQRYTVDRENVEWYEDVCTENQRILKLGDEWYLIDADNNLQPTRAGQPALVPAEPAHTD